MSEVKSAVQNATDANFKEVMAKAEELGKKAVLIDFWSTTCIPCKNLAPVLDEISVQRNDLLVVKVNADEAPDLFRKNRIRSVPSLQLVVDGEVEAQTMGSMSKDQLNDWIDSNI